jgi:hypothetical protein
MWPGMEAHIYNPIYYLGGKDKKSSLLGQPRQKFRETLSQRTSQVQWLPSSKANPTKSSRHYVEKK